MVSPVPGGQNDGSVDISVRIVADQATINKTKASLVDLKKSVEGTFAPNNATIQQARTHFAQHRAELEKNRAQAQRVDDVYVKWGRSLNEIARQNVIKKLTEDLVAATKSGENLDVTMQRVKTTLQSINASQSEVSGVVGAAARAANAPVGRSAGSRALQEFGREARLSVPALAIPGTGISSEFIFRIGEVAGRLGLSLGQLAIAGGAVTAAFGILALGIQNFQNNLKPVTDLLKGIVEGRAAAAGILASQGPAGIVSETERLRTLLDQQRGERDSLVADIATIKGNLRISADPNALLPGQTGLEAIFNRLVANQGPLNDFEAKLADLNNNITENEAALDDLNKRYAENLELVRNAEAAQREIAIRTQFDPTAGGTAEAARKRLDAINAERTAILDVTESADISAEALGEFMARFNELGEEFKIIQEILPRLEDIERIKQAEEDREEALDKLNDLSQKVIDTQAQGQERLGAIAEQGARQIETAEKRLSDARTKLIDFNTDAEEKRSQINSDFMQNDLERLNRFIKDTERAKREGDKELLRAAQDHRDALFDAELENSVAQFLAEQRNFKKEQERRKQDLSDTTKDRLEDFEAEREKAREVRDEKLAALDAESAKRRAVLEAEIVEQDAALQKTKDDIAAKLRAEEDAIQARFEALVQNLDTSTQAMTAITTQAMAILQQQGINVAAGIVGELRRQSGEFVSTTSNTNTGTGVSPVIRPIGFAVGTTSTRRVFGDRPALIAVNDGRRDMDEAIFPYPRHLGFESALAKLGAGRMGGPVYNITLSNVNLGAVTEHTLRRELTHVVSEMAQGIGMARGAA